ncbi:defensin-1-like isoform X2 [Frieseomelitta varia]|uniref:defensin-1-like isoform X2 n=1 Tax=Frieseomelitta varia TaxID=561572 RepID=UPI001CB6A740|nr:defensin-1-like isoform X2 [Frieseomelitta varia]
MVKNCFLVALLFVAVATIMAVPVEKEPLELSGAEEPADGQVKLSCNLGDGVCALHCVSEGKAGGRCKNGICYCVQK